MATAAPSTDDERAEVLRHAWAAFARGEWASAADTFDQCLKATPTDGPHAAEAAFGLAHAAAAAGTPERIGPALARALALAGDGGIKSALVGKWTSFNAAKRAIDPARVGLAQIARNEEQWRQHLRVLAAIYEEAADFTGAIAVFYTLIAVAPRDAATMTRIGRLWMLAGTMREAVPFFRKALALDPGYGLAAELLATVLWNDNDIPGVRDALESRAQATSDPVEQLAVRFKAATVHPPLARSEAEIDDLRAHYESFLRMGPSAAVPDPWKLGLGLNAFADYHARPDRTLREAAASYFLKATPSLGENLTSKRAPSEKIRAAKIRVGLVSHYFYNHTVAYLTAGLIRGLDRRQFDVVLFRTPHGRRDAATDALAKNVTLITLPASLGAARRVIADAALDVLHYPELGSDPYTYFLAFARLAPLQTVTWGHPVTTGLASVDLYLSQSDMEPADADAHYTERLVRLKELSINVRRPATPELLAREEFGMTANRPAYVCAQNLFKLHHAFDDTLRQILELDRDGLLYFVTHSPQVDGLFARRLQSKLGAHFERVRFLPRATADGFLALLRQADVLLDVPQWAGGKTSLESLAVGTPIVHQPGAFMRGRHTLAFLRKMELTDTIASDAASYAETAVRLVQDGAFRRTVRGAISQRSARLFDDTASIREIENVWRAALKERA